MSAQHTLMKRSRTTMGFHNCVCACLLLDHECISLLHECLRTSAAHTPIGQTVVYTESIVAYMV